MEKEIQVKEKIGRQFGRSMLWYWISYYVVTMIGVAHTFFNVLVLYMGSMAQGPGLGEGYEATKAWHPLYNIIIFTLFGFIYVKGLKQPTFKKALTTGVFWSLTSIVIDLVGWVLIPHPLQLTFKQFYIEYQPWITLVYLAMIIGPVLGYLILSKKKNRKPQSCYNAYVSQ